MTAKNEVAEDMIPAQDPNTITPHTRFVWRHQYEVSADEAIGRQNATYSEQRQEELRKNGVTDGAVTEQHHKDSANLNVMMERMGVKPTDPIPAATAAFWAGAAPEQDFGEPIDLRAVLDIGREASDRFMSLPAKIRSRFHNDPAELYRFVSNPENDDEAVKLGLLKRPEAKKDEKLAETPPPAKT